MKKILVSLISEQTIPNIIVAAYYKPDILWFISTERMERERKTECIESTLRLKGLLSSTKDIKKIVVDQDSLTDCMNKIEGLIEEVSDEVEYRVNITGGNKVMALVAYEIFRDIGQKVLINYIPFGKNELVQIFPRERPLKICEIRERLNLEEYLCSYGFRIQNKNSLERVMTNALQHKEDSQWILDNYEQLKGLMGFLYENLKGARNQKGYHLSATFDKEPASIERELLRNHGFVVKGKLITKDMKKDEIVYLTGGWFEEYVFNEVCDILQDKILDDAKIGVKIESPGGTSNDLDIAFMKGNRFYYIECKTLGNEKEQNIIRDEVYKKGAISTLLGKGEERAIICTTQSQINKFILTRARDYGIEILSIEQVRKLRILLRERFGVQNNAGI
ncbi:MAG: DUF1887 domain-containing protein [Candidatus Jettenia ecosi]|uniref:DUF1887 domain-containing protein n=1 Tax=Candidatus Jettenia ecosi TaxID=2494326 RepID=A0A533QME8_9BACT|nr:MAG: DUF1887 domain-containing protein [Candidatus Jettenia ecosi]